MRRDIRWNDNPTASCDSEDRTEDRCLTSHVRQQSPTIRSRRSEHGMKRQGSTLHAQTTRPGWLGEHLDAGYAIDVLHPRALQPLTISK